MPERITTTESSYPSGLLELLGDAAPAQVGVVGNAALLRRPLAAFFCSRRAPGTVVLRVYDWARAARDAGVPVIGGFQSPLERECLDFLLRGEQPVVVCPARGIESMRVPRKWRSAIEAGRLLVVSPFEDRHRRSTAALAEQRNRFVAALAERVLIAYATPGGVLARLGVEVTGWGKPLLTFDDPANAALVEQGATPITPGGTAGPDTAASG